MSDAKKRITIVRLIIAVILIGAIVAGSLIGYTYYRSNRWIVVQDNPAGWVEVHGELGQKNSAPCPNMILKQGEVKFLKNTSAKTSLLLGYKLTVRSEMGTQEKDALKYAPFLYQVRFRFTLVDKDGFPLQVVESPTEYEIFEISNTRTCQNVCPTAITAGTADNSDGVYVTYILSATKPKSRLI